MSASILKQLLVSIGLVVVVTLAGILWLTPTQQILVAVVVGVTWTAFAIGLSHRANRQVEVQIQDRAERLAERITQQVPEAHSVSQDALVPSLGSSAGASVRERVRATHDELTRDIEALQLPDHLDAVTAVPNRRYIINELRRVVGSPQAERAAAEATGHVLIFRQRDLAAINAMHGRQKTDEWLQNVAESVNRVLTGFRDSARPAATFARLNGSVFIVLLPAHDGPGTTDLIQSLRHTLHALRIRTANDRLCRWSYALTDYSARCDVGKVLARLDYGLIRAENAGHDEVEYVGSDDYRPLGYQGEVTEDAWKDLIESALHEGLLELAVTPAAYHGDDTPNRHEALLRMRDPDGTENIISGYLFMPPAMRLGLSGNCDLRAIELGIQWVQQHPGDLALRVSIASLLTPDFVCGMQMRFTQKGVDAEVLKRLSLEIDAHGFVAYPDEVEAFCEAAAESGVGVGVRRLAEQPAALLRLHKFSIEYIKLGGDLVAGLLDSPGVTQFIAAVTEAVIGQGIKVYAHDVPNAATAMSLAEYGVLLPENEAFEVDAAVPEGAFIDE